VKETYSAFRAFLFGKPSPMMPFLTHRDPTAGT
jgi:hypothetical protein